MSHFSAARDMLASVTGNKPDDLDAVRAIATSLEPFEVAERERILRWVREKLGMPSGEALGLGAHAAVLATAEAPPPTNGGDVRSFVAEKAPKSDVQLAAVVAYYYQFAAPPAERLPALTKESFVDACRKAQRGIPKHAQQTLINAHNLGYFDRADKGQYKLNTVGENLVTMVLPDGASKRSRSSRKRPPTKRAKRASKPRK